jgi:hypothetical protein
MLDERSSATPERVARKIPALSAFERVDARFLASTSCYVNPIDVRE